MPIDLRQGNYIEIDKLDSVGGVQLNGCLKGHYFETACFWTIECPYCQGRGLSDIEPEYGMTECLNCYPQYFGRISVWRWLISKWRDW